MNNHSLHYNDIGDPTVFGNFKIHQNIIESVNKQLTSGNANGYAPGIGLETAREVLAKKYSIPEQIPLTSQDIILTSGCSGALEMSINVLASPGDNILIPKPGFSLYQTISDSRGIKCKHYQCIADRNWEIDLNHLESLIDPQTRAILINNPSNPCGSVFSKQHLLDILNIAQKHHIPIISDEIYEGMAFEDAQFHQIASLSTHVPVLTCGGLAKNFMIPGWRIGWIIIHDRFGAFKQVQLGLSNLATIILGPNSLIQAAIPDIINQVPKDYFDENNKLLKEHSKCIIDGLANVKGLKVITPKGAMYCMIQVKSDLFNDIPDDQIFSQKLILEQGVFCLPGSIFQAPGFVRVVFTAPKEKLVEAVSRIQKFCQSHYLS